MYDTIVLKSPEISLEVKDKILEFCNRYEGIDFSSGELIYSFTAGKLEASYDYRISLTVDNTDWIKIGNVPEKVQCGWYIKVECSLHKLLMNHNVYGGPDDIQKSVKYLINFLESEMYVKLPLYYYWELEKIDVSKIYRFQDERICKKIILNLKNLYYTRRKPMIFDTSVMFSGSTTTLKFYHKGPEFKKHDYKRMQKYINKTVDKSFGVSDGDLIRQKMVYLKFKYDNILRDAKSIIRYECSIKLRKLKDLFNTEKCYVFMVHDSILKQCMESELVKVIKEDIEMDNIIRRSDLVLERLKEKFSSNLASCLYSTWSQIVQFGEETTRLSMSKPTFYRHKKLLIESGVAWNNTTIQLKQFSIVPEDFSFVSDAYVDNSVDIEVLKKLEAVA